MTAAHCDKGWFDMLHSLRFSLNTHGDERGAFKYGSIET